MNNTSSYLDLFDLRRIKVNTQSSVSCVCFFNKLGRSSDINYVAGSLDVL
jgi:hypothetical protein